MLRRPGRVVQTRPTRVGPGAAIVYEQREIAAVVEPEVWSLAALEGGDLGFEVGPVLGRHLISIMANPDVLLAFLPDNKT